MKKNLLVLLLSLTLSAKAQSPLTDVSSINSIAHSIIKNDYSETQKVTAIFNWITDNIAYDIDNMFNINFYGNPQQTIDRTIKTKKGVCQHYAYLFDTLCKKANIQSFIISGYTKQKKNIDFTPHAWCAAKIDGVWKFYDPTWAAGYIDNSSNKFVKQFNADYFETSPQKMIQHHIPFDYIWQLLEKPISFSNFSNSEFNSTVTAISFDDSIQNKFHQNELQQKQSELRRIENLGIQNQLIFDRVNHLKNEISNIISESYVNNYNDAVSEFNEAIQFDNEYINFYNVQFIPKKTDAEIWQMLNNVELHLSKAKLLLHHLGIPPERFIPPKTNSIQSQIDDIEKKLNGQKSFVNKYIGTSKILRKTLFYRYTIYGIPIN
jgi:transglutaminase/protease-like cytokinesis protein 3